MGIGENMRIAIDAMGGDHAPDEIVKGTLDAAHLMADTTLLLVGLKDRIEKLAIELGGFPKNVKIVPATQVVGMDEEPAKALRGKEDSSLRVSLRMVKRGDADAVISAGNTGALVGGAIVPVFGLGNLEGVKRPGIAVPMPTENAFCALMDAGANPNAKPIHLLQYAVMGSVYIQYLRPELQHPTIGLLNIGEESKKGNEVVRETYEALEKSNLNFVGNVEPHKMFSGKVDVVVADGFVGNLMLKMAEGLGGFITRLTEQAAPGNPDVINAVQKASSRLDFSEYGGAPVLGVRGSVVKAHGRSKAKAITNAIKITGGFIKNRLNDRIIDEIKRLSWWGRVSDWFLTKPKDSLENP